MAVVALGVIAVWLGLVAVLRGIAHQRAGGGPVVRFDDARGSPQWWARVLGSTSFSLLVLAPIAELVGVRPWALLDHLPLRAAGLTLAAVGIGGTVHAQSSMGSSWRGDVDPKARTALVTTGPFRWTRNPILTFTLLTLAGIALMVPNIVAVSMLISAVASHQIQVRLVEEPYLRRVHGRAYAEYAERTGRFLPWVGREQTQREVGRGSSPGRKPLLSRRTFPA